jgi:hypothetical protein
MAAALVGELSLGVLNPVTLSALLPAGLQLQGNLTAALSLQASVQIGAPTFPTLALQLEELLSVTIPAMQAGIALGLPGITFSVSAAAALVAAAELALGNLNILIGLLGGSVFVYSFAGGTVSTIGSDLTAAITASPPPGLTGASAATGLLIGAAASNWATVSPYFGGL